MEKEELLQESDIGFIESKMCANALHGGKLAYSSSNASAFYERYYEQLRTRCYSMCIGTGRLTTS